MEGDVTVVFLIANSTNSSTVLIVLVIVFMIGLRICIALCVHMCTCHVLFVLYNQSLRRSYFTRAEDSGKQAFFSRVAIIRKYEMQTHSLSQHCKNIRYSTST